VNNSLIMQGDIRGSQCSAITGIECGVPLLVFIAEAYDGYITAFNEGFGAYGIYFG